MYITLCVILLVAAYASFFYGWLRIFAKSTIQSDPLGGLFNSIGCLLVALGAFIAQNRVGQPQQLLLVELGTVLVFIGAARLCARPRRHSNMRPSR